MSRHLGTSVGEGTLKWRVTIQATAKILCLVFSTLQDLAQILNSGLHLPPHMGSWKNKLLLSFLQYF